MSAASKSKTNVKHGGKGKFKEVPLEEVQHCFHKHQSNKRTVGMAEIEIILKELKLYKDEYMPEFQEALDDNAHQLDLSHFTCVLDKLCGVTRVDASVRAMRAAFDKIDKNRDGFISEDELRAAAPLLDIDAKDVKKMMKAADANKDGKVDFDEFRKMLGNTDSFNRSDETDF